LMVVDESHVTLSQVSYVWRRQKPKRKFSWIWFSTSCCDGQSSVEVWRVRSHAKSSHIRIRNTCRLWITKTEGVVVEQVIRPVY
jgi:excinuclease UvrABC helicase subunit UvrB